MKQTIKEQILELIKYRYEEIDLNDFTDSQELMEKLDYDGSLHMLIDSNIEIYNRPLRLWAVDFYEYVERAIDEGLVDTSKNFDYHSAIQSGQYVYFQELAKEVIEEIVEENNEKNEE
jgi:hypothetical protein